MKRLSPLFARAVVFVVALAAASVASDAASQKGDKEQESKRPRLNLRAQPGVGIAPVRMVLTAELLGGSNDFQEYYCPTLEWTWGDDTTSEASSDCEPYEPGKSAIKRRFTVDHTFKRSGTYKVYVHLKQHDKEVAATSTVVQVQPGAQE